MKRNDRIVGLISFFLENPRIQKNLSFFSERFNAAKASISEDLDIVDGMFRKEEIGYLSRVVGPTGGVKFIPELSQTRREQFVHDLCSQLVDSSRILPGGYLYMSDILGNPSVVRQIGRTIASIFSEKEIDVVMTVETKGIPIAYAVASFLNVPVVIVRRDPKVTEGSSVSINYVSGSSRKIQTMVLPKRSLHEGAKVCIIDDFMKAGGTINGMVSLVEEFNAIPAAIGVLAEADDEEEDRVIENYVSLVKISGVNIKEKKIDVQLGNFLQV